MYKSIYDLKKFRNLRYKHASCSLCNALKSENNITPFALFSIAFIWHCNYHFCIEIFDDDIHNFYLKYSDISNKEMFIKLFLDYKSTFNSITHKEMKKAIQLFEEDNAEYNNLPHGYIASVYNIKQITNEFAKSICFTLNDVDAQSIANELSCIQKL